MQIKYEDEVKKLMVDKAEGHTTFQLALKFPRNMIAHRFSELKFENDSQITSILVI